MQITIIAGRLGTNPEMRYLPDGTAVTNFSVAVDTFGGKGADGKAEMYATWFRVSVFGGQAEACNAYLVKGQSVTVEGRLQSDKLTGGPKLFDRKDGSQGASFELRANSVTFGSRSEGHGDSEPAAKSAAPSPVESDDIPF